MKLKSIASAVALLGASVAVTTATAQPITNGGLQNGSAVVYPMFQLNTDGYTSVLRLTNNHPTDDVEVHLIRVCGGIKSFGGEGFCEASNRQIELTHNQTAVLNVQNFFGINPATCLTRTGYIVAYAVDPNAANIPIVWNYLSGSMYQRRLPNVPFPNATAGAQAWAFWANGAHNNPVPGAAGGAFPILPFDGAGYYQAPTRWHSDFVSTTNAANPVNGRRSAIALATLGINAGAQNKPTLVAVDWYAEDEELFSGSLEYVCHVVKELQDISSSFTQAGLGSFYGTIYLTPNLVPNPNILASPFLAQIKELEPNRETLRNMFHDANGVSTTFVGR